MKPLGLTANRLAINLRVPAARLGGFVNGRRAITPKWRRRELCM